MHKKCHYISVIIIGKNYTHGYVTKFEKFAVLSAVYNLNSRNREIPDMRSPMCL